jgi:acetoacetate decarboxylase
MVEELQLRRVIMAKRKRLQRRFRDFNEPAHIGRIAIGLKQNVGNRTLLVSNETMRRIEETIRRVTKGATVYRARGFYTHDDGHRIEEPSRVIEIISTDDGSAAGCQRFKEKLHNIGRFAARLANQESVLVGVQCASGDIDATFVKARKRRWQPKPR